MPSFSSSLSSHSVRFRGASAGRRIPRFRRVAAALSGSIALLLSVPAFAAQQRIWVGGGNANFRNGPNWSPSGTPVFTTADADWIVFNGGGTAAQIAGTSAIVLNVATNEADGYVVKSFTFNNSSGGTYGTYVFNNSQTLILGDNSAAPTNTGYLTNNTVGLQTFNNSGTNIRSYNIGFSFGGIDAAAGGFLFGSGTIVSIGNQLNTAGHDVTVKGAFDTEINGTLVGTGTESSAGGALFKAGTGTLFLNGNSTTWDGRVTVSAGTVQISASNALGTAVGRTTITGGSDTGNVALKQSASTGDITVSENFYLGGRTSGNTGAHLVNVSGNNTLTGTITLDAGGTEYGFSSTTGSLTVLGNVVVAAGVIAPNLHLSGAGNGAIASNLGADISVIKDGAGTWSLGGTANSYTGATTINAGRLNVATSVGGGGGGAITVGDGAALGVTLTGNSGESLHTTALTLGASAGGTTLAFDLGLYANPLHSVLLADSLTLNGSGNTITIRGDNLNSVLNQPITLLSYNTGSAAGLTLGALPARVTAVLNTATAGKVYLTVTSFDYPRWIGSESGDWDTSTANWQEVLSTNQTSYIQGDSVLFDDNGGETVVNLIGTLTPSAVTVNAGQDYTFTGTGKLSGATGLLKQGTGTLILENGDVGIAFNDYTGTTTIEDGTLQVGTGGETGQLGTGDIIIGTGLPGSNPTLIFNRSDSIEVANDLSGTGTLIKQYANTTLTLSGNNIGFTGVVEIVAGTIKLGNVNALAGVSAINVGADVGDGAGVLDLNGRGLFGVAQTVTIAGDGGGPGALINSGAGGTTAGVSNLILAGDATVGGTGNFYVQGGTLAGNGFTLTKTGGNTVFLANLGETHIGSVIVNTGRLTLTGNTALNSDAGTIQLNSGELGLENTTAAVTKDILIGAGGGLIAATAGTGNLISGNITLAGNVDASILNSFQGAGTLTVTGNIGEADGAAKLTKASAGKLILNGANSYTGGTAITAGVLVFGSIDAIPATGAITSAAGTTVGFGFDVSQAVLDSKLPAVGNLASIALGVSTSNNYDLTSRGATASLGAYTDVTYSGTLALNGPSGALTAYQFGGGGGTLTVTSVLSGATSVNIGAGGSAGIVVLAAANSYTLGTTITAGTLRLGNAAALGPATNPLTISTATSAGTLDLNGYDLTVGSLTSGDNTALITDSSATAGTSTITVNIATGSSTYQGSITNGVNGRFLSLVKDGLGTLVVNKGNGSTYTGDTVIRAGKLDVRVNQAQVLPSGSKLVFSGTGIFSAANNGAAVGSLTLAGLAFNAGEGTVENFKQNAGAISSTITFTAAPTRAGGATGNFTLNGTTDPTLFKFVISSGATGGQSLDGGIYFGGNSFAAYAAAGYVRGLDYAVDGNGLDVGAGLTLGNANGRDVQLSGTVTAQDSQILRTLRIAGANDLTLNAGATLTVTTGGLIKAGGNAATISGGSGLATGGGDLVVNTAGLTDTLTIGTAITAATNGLTKTGLGTLILGGANAYAGDSLVNGGTLHFLNLAALSTATPGSKIRLNTGSTVGFGFEVDQAFIADHVVVPATGSAAIALGVDSAANFDFSATGLNYAAISLGAVGNVTYTGTLTPNGATYRLGGGGGTLTYGQQIAGTNGLVVNSGGLAGTVFLTGANTFSGTAVVEGGSLKVGNAAALGTGKVTVTSGTLDLNGFDIALRNLSGGANAVVTDNSAGSTASVRVNVVSGNQTYSGSFANGSAGRVVSLVKEGAGTLILSKANGHTYGGDTIVNAGALRVRTNNAQVLPAPSHLIFTGTGTFTAANNGNANATTPGALTLAGVAFSAGQGTVDNLDEGATTGSAVGNTLTFTNAPTRAAGAAGNFTLSATSPATVNPVAYKFVFTNAPATGSAFDGGIYFGGGNFAAYDAAGFVRALTYTGTPDSNAVDISVSQTTLGDLVAVTGKDVQLSAAATISGQTDESLHSLKFSGAGNLTLASGATLTLTTGGLLKAGGGASTIIGGAGVTTGGAGDLVARTDVAGDTLTISTSILASTTGGLTKTGAGRLSLAAANDFTGGVWVDGGTLELATTGSIAQSGAVNVNAGTLIVSGSLNGVANLNVKNGATLSGIGSIKGSEANVVLAAGAILAPGAAAANSVGKLTLDLGATGLLDLKAASSTGTGYLRFELGATSDQLALLTGTLNLGTDTLGLNDFTFNARAGFGEGTYVLFDTASAITGTLDAANLTGTLSGFNTTLGLSADGQDLVLNVSAVPEPNAALSLLGGIGMLVGLQRFRRRGVAPRLL